MQERSMYLGLIVYPNSGPFREFYGRSKRRRQVVLRQILGPAMTPPASPRGWQATTEPWALEPRLFTPTERHGAAGTEGVTGPHGP